MSHADQAHSHRGLAAYLEIVGHVEAIVSLEVTLEILRESQNCPLAAAELRDLAADLETLPEDEAPEPVAESKDPAPVGGEGDPTTDPGNGPEPDPAGAPPEGGSDGAAGDDPQKGKGKAAKPAAPEA